MPLKATHINTVVTPTTTDKHLSDNLKHLLKHRGLSITQLAQALDLPMMTIRRLVLGETVDPRMSTLKLVADYFDVSIDVLIGDNDQLSYMSLEKAKSYFAPVLSWDTVGKAKHIEDIDLSEHQEWRSVSFNHQDVFSKRTFALESRPAMYPRFPQGTIFIIDPEATPEDGDIVLVRIRENGELTLRELLIDPPEWRLQSLLADSAKLLFSKEQHEIIGVNLLTMLYGRKT